MRIGIDIDDTITNSWDYLMPIYSREFNISIDKTALPYYNVVKHKVSFEEFVETMKKYEKTKEEIPVKDDVQNILSKLKKEGHTIIFITTRGKTYSDPYGTTKEYLDKYSIPYDKIIIDSYDKSIACKEEMIDLFIDDSPKHCKEVADCGIEVIMMETSYNKDYQEFLHIKDWKQIYKYIQNR